MTNLSLSRFKARHLLALVTLVVVPATLLAVQLIMRAEFDEVRELRVTAQQTVASRDSLARLLILHLDVETGVRGYAITQNPSYLAPYEAALSRRAQLFDDLRREADPAVLAGLPALKVLSDHKLANSAQNIEDVRTGHADIARARIASGRGKLIMDEIRVAIGHLDALEDVRLKRVTSQSIDNRINLERSVMWLLIGLALLLAIVTMIVSRSMRQRREALERAKRLNERERAVFESSIDGMLVLDKSGLILRMNPSIVRMFGYDESDLLGRPTQILMNDQYTAEQGRAWLAQIRNAGEMGPGQRKEFVGRRADGSTFETEVSISQLSGLDGHRYIASIRDISHRKRAEKMKTEFVSTVSHELRTPLTSIGGSLGLLAAGAVGPLGDQAKRLVSIAHSNCERLIRLINDILDIEKIESGKMAFDMRRMQVAPLIRRTEEAMHTISDKQGVALQVELPPWPQCVVGDPDRLEQVLTNLASNAIKHSPDGGTVEIAARQQGQLLRIEVRDRGAGVPQTFRDRIFGKFAMADASDSRAKGGTGLGLSIAREIARHHGGDVGFEDREGGGTVFYLDLPVPPDEPAETAPQSEGLPRILHLDDDHDCLSVVASAFAGRAAVVSAVTLEEAESITAQGGLDGAIVDVGLAPDNGLAIMPSLRKGNTKLPIILFTAMEEPYADAGASRVLIKSRATIEDLVATTMDLVTPSNEDKD